MSRRSNPTKQKNKATLAPSSPSGASSLAAVQPSESTSIQRELLAASLLEALTSAREVDGVFSDYGDVNKEILESASVAPSSLQPMAPLSVEEIKVPCDNATAVMEPEDDEFDFDSDFGANIFAAEEPASARATTYAQISCAVLQELKACESVTQDDAAKTGDNESETWDEISLEDCCFEESPEPEQPLFENAAAYEFE
ncbi:MAG: hypothetical protein DWI00_09285, partial [Planctomycetota bacterium]